MTPLETRVRRLELKTGFLWFAAVIGCSFGLAGWVRTPPAVAGPKAPDAEFNTVRAAEVLAKDVDADGLIRGRRGVLIQDAAKKNSVAVAFSPAGEPGVTIKTPDDRLTLLPTGLLIRSAKTKASFVVTKAGDSYRVVVTDKDGKETDLGPAK